MRRHQCRKRKISITQSKYTPLPLQFTAESTPRPAAKQGTTVERPNVLGSRMNPLQEVSTMADMPTGAPARPDRIPRRASTVPLTMQAEIFLPADTAVWRGER
jgi:hypothetical protein